MSNARKRGPRRRPDTTAGQPWLRWTLVAVIPATALMVWPGALNPVEPPKLVLLVIIASLCAAAALQRRPVDATTVSLPAGPFAVAAVAAVAALSVATLASGYLQIGMYGGRGRLDGVLLYLAVVVIALAAGRQLGGSVVWGTRMVTAIGVGAGVVAAIGLLQAAGLSPLGLDFEGSGAFATLGNPNFLAGWGGTVSGVVLVLVLWAPSSRTRLAWGATLLATLAAVLASGSTQGLGAAGTSCAAALAVHTVRTRSGRPRTLILAGIGGVGAVGMAVLAAGLAGAGPLQRISVDIGTRLRGYYWDAALTMAGDNPLVGVGPGRFAWEYRTARVPAAAAEVGAGSVADNAHNVWLNFLATGGVLTVLPFAAIVVLSVVAVLRLLRRDDLSAAHYPLLAALAALQGGYLIQSIVSIDVPSLVTLHLVSAGVLAAMAGTLRWREVTLPAALARPAVTFAVVGVGVVVGVLAVGLSVRPLVAEVAARSSATAPDGGADRLATARTWAGWEPFYAELLGGQHTRDGAGDAAIAAFAVADELAAPNAGARVSAARVAAEQGDTEQAGEWYRRALEAEPHHPDIVLEVARFDLMHGDATRAGPLVDGVLEHFPDHPEARELAADIADATGG